MFSISPTAKQLLVPNDNELPEHSYDTLFNPEQKQISSLVNHALRNSTTFVIY